MSGYDLPLVSAMTAEKSRPGSRPVSSHQAGGSFGRPVAAGTRLSPDPANDR